MRIVGLDVLLVRALGVAQYLLLGARLVVALVGELGLRLHVLLLARHRQRRHLFALLLLLLHHHFAQIRLLCHHFVLLKIDYKVVS